MAEGIAEKPVNCNLYTPIHPAIVVVADSKEDVNGFVRFLVYRLGSENVDADVECDETRLGELNGDARKDSNFSSDENYMNEGPRWVLHCKAVVKIATKYYTARVAVWSCVLEHNISGHPLNGSGEQTVPHPYDNQSLSCPPLFRRCGKRGEMVRVNDEELFIPEAILFLWSDYRPQDILDLPEVLKCHPWSREESHTRERISHTSGNGSLADAIDDGLDPLDDVGTNLLDSIAIRLLVVPVGSSVSLSLNAAVCMWVDCHLVETVPVDSFAPETTPVAAEGCTLGGGAGDNVMTVDYETSSTREETQFFFNHMNNLIDRTTYGWDRIVEAVQCHIWPGCQRATGTRPSVCCYSDFGRHDTGLCIDDDVDTSSKEEGDVQGLICGVSKVTIGTVDCAPTRGGAKGSGGQITLEVVGCSPSCGQSSRGANSDASSSPGGTQEVEGGGPGNIAEREDRNMASLSQMEALVEKIRQVRTQGAFVSDDKRKSLAADMAQEMLQILEGGDE